ncbi:hypothetical protein P376_4959 [Streptomyces sp. HCCB10043]|nr:hypothetical protein P376_4959 [Streptomyces sp. HCCB10043]
MENFQHHHVDSVYSVVGVMGSPAVRLFAIRSLTVGQVTRLHCAEAVTQM